MKFTKKATALLLVTLLCITFMRVTGTKADYFDINDYVSVYQPVFELETINNGTGVKISIPRQCFYENAKYNEAYYPTGYEITVVPNGKVSKTVTSYSDGLYDLYDILPNTGYGPYMKTIKELPINVTFETYENGSEDREYIYDTIPAGDYTVKLVAVYDVYYNRYTSKTSTKSLTIKEAADTKIKAGYKTKYDFSKVKKGDTIKFGSYEQDMVYENGREPIEWIVLEKTDKQMLVISKYSLDKLPYNNSEGEVTWEKCTLRKWLNESFYDFAFNKQEKKLIKTTTVKASVNPETKVSSGNKTKDKLFILSIQDVLNKEYGFSTKALKHDELRRGAYAWNPNAGGRWWLRTPGFDTCNVLFVGSEGGLEYSYGTNVLGGYEYYGYVGLGVRPAMYISIK